MGNLTRTFRHRIPRRRYLIAAGAVGLFLLLWPARPLRSDNFVFYFPGTHQVVPLRPIGHARYFSVLRVLNAVGTVSGLQEGSDLLTVYFGSATLKFRAGKKKVEADKKGIKLADPVRVEEGQWLVPLDFLSKVLPRILKEPVEYNSGSTRAFVGAVHPATFALHLTRLPQGARLTVDFTGPVSMSTASQNGKYYLYLGERAIQPLEHSVKFQNPYLASVQFDDQDGRPKLILTPREGGLDFYPTLGDHNRTIHADLLKPQASIAQKEQPSPVPPSTSSAAPTAPGAQETPPFPSPTAASNLPVVVLDPGHGGNNLGSQGANGVVEKNLVAQLATRARVALLGTGKFRVVLTRTGDADPNFDERDTTANAARPLVFISFHAGNLGLRSPQVFLYTYQSSLPPAPDNDPPALFRPWAGLQQSHLAASRKFGEDLREQLSKVSGVADVELSGAPVRVLRSVDAPAIALEVGSLATGTDPAPLLNPQFQQGLANAIVRAVQAFRSGGAQP